VGLSTEIPPHHLGECVEALLHYIKHPKSSLDDLMKYIPGPDFPGGGILRASFDERKDFYKQGKGKFHIDALIEQNGSSLVIKEIPYMATTSKIIEQIQSINQAKPIVAPFELIDESDEMNPVRVVLNFKTALQAKAALAVILEKTDCSISYRCYFNAIDRQGLPRCFSLKEFFEQWLEYRLESLLAQFEARQQAVIHRRRVLAVYKIGFYSLDAIFDALRHSEDPWGDLKRDLNLNDEDIEILSALRLKELSRLSLDKIELEEKDLIDESDLLSERIRLREKRLGVIIEQLKALKLQYGDRRRTKILDPRPKFLLSDCAIVVTKEEPKSVWILLTEFGWLKLIRPMKNSADIDFQGHCRQGDRPVHILKIMDDCSILFVDQRGRFYAIHAHTVPSSKFGEHLSSLLSLPSGNHIIFMTEMQSKIAVASSQGYGFIVDLEDSHLNKRGKNIAKMVEGEHVIWAGASIPKSGIFISSMEQTYGILSLEHFPMRQSGRGVILWKNNVLVDKAEGFLFGKDTLSLVSSSGKKSTYDENSIMMKRGQSLKSSGKKSIILVKN
jgi:topoisomerase-4 subunit A